AGGALDPAAGRHDAEGHPLLDTVVPIDDVLDGRVDVLALGLGEEADVPEVHAEHGGAGATGQLGAAQDRAVAAEDDDELDVPSRVVAGVDDGHRVAAQDALPELPRRPS